MGWAIETAQHEDIKAILTFKENTEEVEPADRKGMSGS